MNPTVGAFEERIALIEKGTAAERPFTLSEDGKRALNEEGMIVRVNDVLSLTMNDAPGGTLGVLRALAENGISVEYMYAGVSKLSGKAFMIIRADDPEAAESLLVNHGFAEAEIDGI